MALKPLEEIGEADFAHQVTVLVNRKTGETEPLAIDHHHAQIKGSNLPSVCPRRFESGSTVRETYFSTVGTCANSCHSGSSRRVLRWN